MKSCKTYLIKNMFNFQHRKNTLSQRHVRSVEKGWTFCDTFNMTLEKGTSSHAIWNGVGERSLLDFLTSLLEASRKSHSFQYGELELLWKRPHERVLRRQLWTQRDTISLFTRYMSYFSNCQIGFEIGTPRYLVRSQESKRIFSLECPSLHLFNGRFPSCKCLFFPFCSNFFSK